MTAQCFLSALTGVPRRGCAPPPLPPPNSTLFIYMNGHGAEGLLKFRDNAELTSAQLATGLVTAKAAGRFRRALLVLDTCHAESILQHIPAAKTVPAATLSPPPQLEVADSGQDAFVNSIRDRAQLLSACREGGAVLCSAAATLIDALPACMQWLAAPIGRLVAHVLQQWDPPNSIPLPPLNIDIVATSSWEKSSYAAGFDSDLGTPLADGFVTTLFRRTLSPTKEHYGQRLQKLTRAMDASLAPAKEHTEHDQSRTPRQLSHGRTSPRIWKQSAAKYFMRLPHFEVGSQCVLRSDHGAASGMQSVSLEQALAQERVLSATRDGHSTLPA